MVNSNTNSQLISTNRIQKYCLSKGMSSIEAYNFAMNCKDLGLLDSIDITLPEETCCENCLYSKKCDAPIITDNRINANNCGSFVNVKDVIIKADVLSKLCNIPWFSCNDRGVLHSGASNGDVAYYKYSDIIRVLGVEDEAPKHILINKEKVND